MIFRLARILALVVLAHLAFFVAFPDTGPRALPFLAVSLVAFTVVVVLVNSFLIPFMMITRWAGRVFEVSVYFVVLIALLLLWPQASGVSPAERLAAGKWPTRADLERGLGKLGVDLDEEAAKARERALEKAEELKEEAEKKLD